VVRYVDPEPLNMQFVISSDSEEDEGFVGNNDISSDEEKEYEDQSDES